VEFGPAPGFQETELFSDEGWPVAHAEDEEAAEDVVEQVFVARQRGSAVVGVPLRRPLGGDVALEEAQVGGTRS
jgi:hypothetical protein